MLRRGYGSTVVPALPTDFMFTAVATELGYIGGVGILLGFLVLIQRGFVIAANANDGFSKLLAGGLTALLWGGLVRIFVGVFVLALVVAILVCVFGIVGIEHSGLDRRIRGRIRRRSRPTPA